MTGNATATAQTAKDFTSDQQVRWCPGCGDYAILNSMRQVFADLGIAREEVVVISGIGCAARFPYSIESYGSHTIHGRAPAIATGLKVARPELSVWVVGGDGDMLSIGGNHLLHALRRNVDIKILCFDNRIYGLTKGQASPTSEFGKRTYSTPMGSVDRPVNPLSIALASEATFVARTADVFGDHLRAVMAAAAAHKGSSFVQILQNCVIFNKDAFAYETDRETRDEHSIYVEHGKPLRFGAERQKGLRLDGFKLEVVTIGEDGVTEKDILVHDETDESLAFLLSRMPSGLFPTPMGILRRRGELPTLEAAIHLQIEQSRKQKGAGDLMGLLHSGDVWQVP
jgi:2-oxoglutarate ferredoxin oxidoreductase subunit beta